jgi:CheY-like chemotaxis protein
MPAQIIVLENDAASRELIHYLLTMFGHEVRTVGTPEQAMTVLADKTPDLIITDLQLSHAMDGYGFGAWCRNEPHLAGIPLLCITASWDKYNPNRVQGAGFTALIPKPINPAAFVFQVEFYLPPTKHGTQPSVSV